MQHGIKEEKGFILILALVTMIAMTVIGLSVVMNMTTDLQLSRNVRDAKTALQLAEAGINEAVARLHIPAANARYSGEKSTDANYRDKRWNAPELGGTNLGRDFNSDNSIVGPLPSGHSYSVTIRYLYEPDTSLPNPNSNNPEGYCDSNNNNNVQNTSSGINAALSPNTTCVNTNPEIVMFGKDFKVSGTLTNISYGKLPVYRITSAGTVNGTTRTIISYIGASTLNTDTEYGINTNGCVDVSGGANNLGEVKQGTDPSTGLPCGCDPQITGSCAANKATSDNMNTYLGEEIAEVINMADEKHKCTNGTCSNPGDDIPSSGKIDSVVANWGDFAGNTYSTLIYIDNASPGKEVEISGNFSGRGILVVSGDLKLSGSLQYEGLIYVFGTLTLSGGGSNLNVLGGIMANNTVGVNGNITVTYDQPTLLDVAKENSTSAAILWKRL